ncbi:hypothetical protein OROHE_026169 [Orobanche hederae]
MDSSSKIAGAAVTPTKGKSTHSIRSRLNGNLKRSENHDPNVSSHGLELCSSPSTVNSGISAIKSTSRKANPKRMASPSPKKKIRERKFVMAKRKLGKEDVNSSSAAVICEKCKQGTGKSKCLCVAYESLRASQDDFFKNPGKMENGIDLSKLKECDTGSENTGIDNEGENERNDALSDSNEINGELGIKRSRDRLLEKARESVPESGRVMHLVQAFEKLLMMPKSGVSDEKEVDDDKQFSYSSSFSPSDFFLTSESLGLDSGRSYSLESSQGSISTRTSTGGRKSGHSSTDSYGTRTKRHSKSKPKQKKETSQKPFMLRTEQRGRSKEEGFMKKLQQMLEEEEKLRIPVAQGLPWTTDEPEFPAKPLVKENTRPVDLVLHSDTRAAERSEFDSQVVKKMNLIKQYRMERERQQKQAEEEEIRRLRKELVPKAQQMPYFDRPFIPKRSMKQPTLPKDPKIHLPQHKKIKCHLSLDDLYTQE